MSERPILFSGPMVRALLAGRKSQTRRVVKPQPPLDHDRLIVEEIFPTKVDQYGEEQPGKVCYGVTTADGEWCLPCPYGAPGDRLWVREGGWERPERTPRMMRDGADTWESYYYAADLTETDREQFKEWGFKRRPSIFMPRWACRTFLEVTVVRVERLGDITAADARAEGIFGVRWRNFPGNGWTSDDGQPISETPVRAFEDLWNSIHGAWLPETWVWVVEFKRVL